MQSSTNVPQPDASTGFKDIDNLYGLARQFTGEIARFEAELAAAKGRLAMIVEDQLPKLMTELGVKSFVSSDGVRVEVVDHLENSIPVARKKEAMEWLINNGHADIIKSEVAVTFPSHQRDAALALMSRLANEYGGSVGIAQWAEPSTLKSVLRRRIEEGAPVPMDLFGARACQKVKFSEPKKTAGRL